MQKLKKKAVLVFLLCAVFISCVPVNAASGRVKIGQCISVRKDGATYKSGNKKIATVSKDGCVTARSKGKVTIFITRDGKTKKKTIQIVANEKKPDLKVSADEIVITGTEVNLKETIVPQEPVIPEEPSTENPATDSTEIPELVSEPDSTETVLPEPVPVTYRYTVKVHIKNSSSCNTKSIELKGKIAEQDVTLKCKSLGAKKTAVLTVEFVTDKELVNSEFELTSTKVRSGGMYHFRDYEKNTMSYTYATEDTKAPVITGFVGKNSYNEDIPYQTVYKDRKDKFDYFKYVKAEDDRDTKVKLTVDTSKVNFNKKGTYRITYIAEDKAGNKTKKKAHISVRVNDQYDEFADQILSSITKKSWSDQKKAVAIYNFIRSHMRYVEHSDHSSWERAAVNGIRYGRGDCFSYFSIARLLLTRAGIPNIRVNRVRGVGRHYWNMAYVKGGFYHYDCCPRSRGGRFCLLTDDQLKWYSSHVGGNSHIWAYDKKPKSPKKKISSIF